MEVYTIAPEIFVKKIWNSSRKIFTRKVAHEKNPNEWEDAGSDQGNTHHPVRGF